MRGILRGLGRVVLGVAIAVAILVAFAAFMRVQHVTPPTVSGGSAVGRMPAASRIVHGGSSHRPIFGCTDRIWRASSSEARQISSCAL